MRENTNGLNDSTGVEGDVDENFRSVVLRGQGEDLRADLGPHDGSNVACINCRGGGPFLMDQNSISTECVLRNGVETPYPYKNDKYIG
jgi:hypothetical protein